MRSFNLAAATLAAALLSACGGGGTDGTPLGNPDGNPDAPITVGKIPAPAVTAADCPRLTSEAASITAVDLSNPTIKAVNDFVLAVDPEVTYKVFVRRPEDFVNRIAATSGKVDLASLPGAAHDTLHLTHAVLQLCAPTGYKALFKGTIHDTGLQAGDTAAIGILDAAMPGGLKGGARYKKYILDAAVTDDFTTLLDEFVAHTTGARAEVEMLKAGRVGGYSGTLDGNLAGMVEFMLYLEAYLESARVGEPATYAAIQASGGTKAALQAAWSEAERVLKAAYPYVKSGDARLAVGTGFLQMAYTDPNLAELDGLGITHLLADDWLGTYLDGTPP